MWGQSNSLSPQCDSRWAQCPARPCVTPSRCGPGESSCRHCGSVCGSEKTRRERSQQLLEGGRCFWRPLERFGSEAAAAPVLTGADRLTCPRDGGNEHCKSESALPRVQLPALLAVTSLGSSKGSLSSPSLRPSHLLSARSEKTVKVEADTGWTGPL